MSRVFVCGLGAVSPAGWDVPALRNALQHGEPLPPQKLEHPGWVMPLQARHVPNQTPRPAFFSNPRLRRASPMPIMPSPPHSMRRKRQKAVSE